jgi:hypothetical protein
MKKLVILLVVFLALGGGGGAAWWFLLREQPEGELAEISEEDATSLISVIRVLRLDPIVLAVVREDQVTLHITAVVVIELTDSLESEALRKISEPLRDAMLSELYGIYSVRYVQERGYDIPIVRQRLGLAAERVLGEGTVKSVRLQDIAKRVPTSG